MPTILIIEDEYQLRKNLERLLKFQDFKVLVAEDGAQGLSLAKENIPDLIICDIMMPVMDGYSVKQQLSEDPATDAIPFIFLTAKASPDELRQGMNLGADDYITKPLKLDDLMTAIQVRLQRRDSLSQPYRKKLEQLEKLLERNPEQGTFKKSLIHQDLEKYVNQFLPILPNTTEQLSLLLFELCQYLEISSFYGHATANALLVTIGKNFEKCLQDQAITEVVITQLGGNHLAVLIPPKQQLNEDKIEAITLTLLESLQKPLLVKQSVLKVQGKIGIAMSAESCHSWDMLLSNAEIALQSLHDKQQNSFQFFRSSLQRQLSRRYQIESLLPTALKEEEFELYFQPQVSIDKRQIVGAEALIRWPHSKLSPISPVEFIAVAEQSSFIKKLGDWVLKKACEQTLVWQQQGATNLKISVNLSAHQLYDQQLITNVQKVLQETGLSPDCLDLEITEGIFIESPKQAQECIEELRKLGVRISIDDFGTGYSTLSYLQDLTLQTLKIDQSFVRRLSHNSESGAIVEMIIQLAKNLNLDVIAEGVENEQELEILKAYGCKIFQGYLFSKPCSAEKFTSLLRQKTLLS